MAEIKVSGNLAAIRGISLDLAEKWFTYHHLERGRGGKVRAVRKRLYEPSGDGMEIIIPAGLLHRAKSSMAELGIPYTEQILTPLPKPEPDWSRLAGFEFRQRQDELLATISVEDRGIIEAPTGYGKSFVIKCICRMYPDIRIAVVAPSISIAKQLYNAILEVCDDVGMVGAGRDESEARITVAVRKSLGKVRLRECSLILYDECHTAASPQTSEILATVRNARMFGFTATPAGRSDGAELKVEALFGPVIFVVDYSEAVESGSVVPIKVKVYTIGGQPLPFQTQTALQRHGYWRNRIRNAKIAEIAESFPKDVQVLILVDKVEHALFLKLLLPDYPMVYGSTGADRIPDIIATQRLNVEYDPLDDEKREELKRKFASGELKRAIATGVWGTGVDFPELGVLIRADGQSGGIPSVQKPGRVSRTHEGKVMGIVIDFKDVFDERLLRRSYDRFRHYKKKGWSIEFVEEGKGL